MLISRLVPTVYFRHVEPFSTGVNAFVIIAMLRKACYAYLSVERNKISSIEYYDSILIWSINKRIIWLPGAHLSYSLVCRHALLYARRCVANADSLLYWRLHICPSYSFHHQNKQFWYVTERVLKDGVFYVICINTTQTLRSVCLNGMLGRIFKQNGIPLNQEAVGNYLSYQYFRK